jgi:hypothetical protein
LFAGAKIGQIFEHNQVVREFGVLAVKLDVKQNQPLWMWIGGGQIRCFQCAVLSVVAVAESQLSFISSLVVLCFTNFWV